eukprot:41789_1
MKTNKVMMSLVQSETPTAEEVETAVQNNEYDNIYNKNLFDIANNNHNEPTDRIQRVISISHSYGLWINHHRIHLNSENDITNNTYISNIYDIINTKFSPSYDFRHFLLDYRFVISKKELLLNEDKMKDNEICNAETCVIINRNNRNREYYGNNNIRRNKLYFVHTHNTHNKLNEEIIRNISTQQILDSLHSFIHHTLHIDNNAFIQLYNQKNDNDNIEFDTICHDEYAEKIIQLIENEIKSSNKYRVMNMNENCAKKKIYYR